MSEEGFFEKIAMLVQSRGADAKRGQVKRERANYCRYIVLVRGNIHHGVIVPRIYSVVRS